MYAYREKNLAQGVITDRPKCMDHIVQEHEGPKPSTTPVEPNRKECAKGP